MSAEPTAEELLARVRAAYAACTTYRDTGVVETRFELLAGGYPPDTSTKPFATWLVRPDRFRFEFAEEDIGPEDEWDRMVILRDGAAVRQSWTVCPGEQEQPTLEDALAGAKGVSSNASWTVPALLLPEAGDGLGRVAEARLAGRREVDGIPCDGVAFDDRRGERGVMWFGRDDHLLRLVEEEMLFDEGVLRELQDEEDRWRASLPPEERARQAAEDARFPQRESRSFRTRTVTRYRPERDAAIDPRVFESLRSALVPPRPLPPPLRAPESGAPDAVEILSSVRRAYARCSTFRDAGTTTYVTLEDDGSRRTSSRWAFTVAFQRPERLRFESARVDLGRPEDWHRFVYVFDCGRAMARDGRGKRLDVERDQPTRLRRAFLSLALLFSEGPDSLPKATSATRVGLDELDGRECFVVRGTREDGRELTLHISRADALVLRCVHVEEFGARTDAEALERIRRRLAGTISDSERRALEKVRERPIRPHRSEVTTVFDPRPDAAVDERTFAID